MPTCGLEASEQFLRTRYRLIWQMEKVFSYSRIIIGIQIMETDNTKRRSFKFYPRWEVIGIVLADFKDFFWTS